MGRFKCVMAKPSEEESVYHNNVVTLNFQKMRLTNDKLKNRFLKQAIHNNARLMNKLKKQCYGGKIYCFR